MNTFSSNLQGSHMNLQTTSSNGGGVINAASLSKLDRVPILELKVGDSFKGEIASVNGEEVTINLSNGELLQAKIEGEVLLSVGELIQFQVQSNEQNKIVLKPFLQNQQMIGESVLKAAGLPVNDRTKNLVANLLENGMSVDKNNLILMNRASLNFPNTNLTTLSMLNKLNIPLTQDNITQYENYKNLEYKLLDSVENIYEDIEAVYNSLPEGEKGMFLRDVLSTVIEYNNAENNNTGTNNAVKLDFNNIDSSKYEDSNLNNKDINIKELNNLNVENKNTETSIIEKNDNENIVTGENEIEATKDVKTSDEEIINKENINEKDINEKTINEETTNKINTNKDNLTELNNNTQVQKNDNQTNNLNLINSDKQNTISKAFNAEDSNAEDSNTEALAQEKPLTSKNTILQENNNLKPELEALLNEKTDAKILKKLIRDTLKRNWSLEPKDVESKEEVQKLYNKVQKDSARLQEIIDNYNKNPDISPKSAENVQKNLHFMQELDQTFSYVQLPLQFSEGKAHGDLYVMTNKKNLARNDGTLTAFLHLDMTNLGSTDIRLTLQTEQNKLRCDFYLQEDSLKLVTEHIEELNEALRNKGYTIKTTINPYEEEKTVSIMDRMEESAGLKMTQMSYRSFDIRA